MVKVEQRLPALFTKYGKKVRQYARSILTKRRRNTKIKQLYNDLDYMVNFDSTKGKYSVWIDVGGAEDYWAYVESGVQGRESSLSNVGKNRGVLKLPAFQFKKKNVAEGVIESWIGNKPIKLRGADGKFMKKTESNINSASFLIGRAIASRGLPYSGFLSTPIITQNKNLKRDMAFAFGKDLKGYMFNQLEKSVENDG